MKINEAAVDLVEREAGEGPEKRGGSWGYGWDMFYEKQKRIGNIYSVHKNENVLTKPITV